MFLLCLSASRSKISPMFLLIFILNVFLVSAQDNVQLAALAKIGDGPNKVTLTTRDLQMSLFLNEYQKFLQDYEEKKDPLRELVWESLIHQEAKKILNQDVTPASVKEFASQFKKKLAGDKLWSSFSFADGEINDAVKKRLAAQRLLRLKMGDIGLIYVSNEEVESYYIQNRNQLGQRPISEVREKIKAGLQAQKAQERFRDWINALTRTHGVAYYSGYKIQ